MKFTCLREDLLKGIGRADKAVPGKSTTPVMEGMLIEAKDDHVKLTGNNLDLSIETFFPATVEKPGKIVLNCRMLSDIIRRTGDEHVKFEVGEKNITTISSGQAVFEIAGIDAQEFPETPDFNIDKKLVVESAVLKTMIKQTIFATYKGEDRKILTGELFKIEGDILSLVALDGYRLAIRKEKMVEAGEVESFVVPDKNLNELLKILDEEGNVDIYPSERFVMFEFSDCSVVSRLIEGEYTNYDKIVEVECPIKCKGDVRRLLDTFERVSPIILNETVKSPVKINIFEDNIIIDCATLSGRVHDEASIEKLYGDNLEIGFNNKYLLDAFGACDEDEVFLEFASALSPVKITPVEGDQFTFIILPVRLKN